MHTVAEGEGGSMRGRAWAAVAALGLAACAEPVPLGIYRLPVQTGDREVELRTVLVRIEDQELALFDGHGGGEFARGRSEFSWQGEPMPFEFDAPRGFPMKLFVRDSVIEDDRPRPYAKTPAHPLATGAAHLQRVTLTSGSERRTLMQAGGVVWVEGAEPQPDAGVLPGPLFALNSVSGVGLGLPAQMIVGGEWRDQMSLSVPFDATQPMPCGAPLTSLFRVKDRAPVSLPAGDFDALHVVEIVDACRAPVPAEVKVFQVDRWFVPGVGPVRVSYLGSDSKRRDYRLVSYEVRGGSTALWPVAEGNVWTYEVRAPDGSVSAPIEVRVERVETIGMP